ncbi:MAG: energy transducer TonB [Paludibacteraceae bacterium]|nr:energy transducer TonB [Paludibacteraceae bacterium]
MKKELLLLLLMVGQSFAGSLAASNTEVTGKDMYFSTDDDDDDDIIMVIVETKAKFPGGEEEMKKFIRANMSYPKGAIDGYIEGTVLLSITVKEDGSIADVNIKEGVHSLLDMEAIRVAYRMPKWIPAQRNGQPMSSKVLLPIEFKLNNSADE